MATTMKLVISLCLLSVLCIDLSEAFKLSVNEHLIKSCPGYMEKKRGEGYRCDSEVIDHVHDYAEQFEMAGYNGDIVEDYLDMANGGGICYMKDSKIEIVKGDCAAMELVCSEYEPQVVDFCSKLRKQQSMATTAPTTTTEPATEGAERPEIEFPTPAGRAKAFQ
nr:uncharacterized protein LOC129280623 [Lytechinus pictus]